MEHFSFSNQGSNTYLIYELEETQNLDSLCMGMIKNNHIQGILPVSFQQIDKKRYLRYTISSKITLDKFYAGEVNKRKLLNIFQSILESILEGEEYMIPISSYFLDESKIYVDVSVCKAFLICLPIEGREPTDIRMFFKNIVFQARYDKTEDSSYIAELINALNGSSPFSITDFKRVVDNLISQDIPQNKPAAHNASNIQNISEPVLSPQMPEKQENYINMQIPTQNVGMDIPLNTQIPVQNNGMDMPYNAQMPVQNSNMDVPFMDGFTGAAMEGKKRGLFGGLFKKKIQKNNNIQMNIPEFDFGIPGMENQMDFAPAMDIVNTMPQQPQRQDDIPIPANFGETTVLTGMNYNETTVLSQSALHAKPMAYLIRKKTQEKIIIKSDIFHIGREAGYADYCVSDNPAVSKSHADIIKKGDNYMIVDTNSQNGTRLNGRFIMSNIEESLSHGMEIVLADEEFEFHEW